jgi:2-methylisocitrate lyase-like PEP mutase family enzyme
LSIEDATGDQTKPLYDRDDAIERMRAARAAIDKTGTGVLLTGRCECFLWGKPDLAFAIDRLKAYADAGADVLYAPGIRTREQIEAVVTAVAPKPVNLLMPSALGFAVSDIAAMGVRRISVGSTLARVAWGAFMQSAKEIAEKGTFDSFKTAVPNPEMKAFFQADLPKRPKP